MQKFASLFFRKPPWLQIKFPASGFEIIDCSTTVEEEHLEEFQTGLYYPVEIGDVFASRYQVGDKLGFGVTSTVWLARDLL
jgi:serine/threonine-protein kinase SRPK3